ncbi:MAG: alpha-L-fucosidase [Kiritimatiellia bacterium]|jgi:alpha-L-fucosidase
MNQIEQKPPVQAPDSYVEPSSPLVRERLEWFKDQKLCFMMHFGLYTQMGITESWPLVTKDAFWARADIEWERDDAAFKKQYYALNRSFNPLRFNAGEIARKAKACGFRYVAFTTKHHDGFCLFDTKYTDYKVTDPSCPYSTNPNADIVKSLFNACRAEGLGISCYFSKADFHHEDYWEGRGIGRYTDRWPTYDVREHPEKWSRFRDFAKNQMLELVGNYGPIDILWLDGGWFFEQNCGCDMKMEDVVESARKIKPDLIVVDRGSNDECMNVKTPEQCVPEKPLSYPWETCMTMADGWGYHYDDVYKSPRQLIHLLVDIVAKGGNLALNVGPMPDGRLPRPAVERMEAMGAWLVKNGGAIYATRAVMPCALGKWRFTRTKDGRVFAIRLWDEAEHPLVALFMNLDLNEGAVQKVVHLASGREFSFSETTGDYERGITLNLPEGFKRDAYADAFEIHR